jgi:hypothetical protein
MVEAATRGMVKDRPWPAQLNKLVWSKRQSTTTATTRTKEDRTDGDSNNKSTSNLVVSIGQVVPHEVMGMANFNKNLFVGVGTYFQTIVSGSSAEQKVEHLSIHFIFLVSTTHVLHVPTILY